MRLITNDENDEKDDKYKFNNIDLNKKENPLIKKNIKKMKKSQNKIKRAKNNWYK